MSKFYYQGMTLSKYCKDNDLKYQNICYEINKILQKIEVKPTDTEKLIDIIINEKVEKIVYKGKNLKQHCRKHELDFFSIKYEIIKMILNRLEVDDELIDKAIRLSPDSIKKSCYLKGMSYATFKYRLEILNNNPAFKKLSNKEKEQIALEKEKTGTMYKGVPLRVYCEINRLNYRTINYRIKKIIKSGEFNDKSKEEIIELAISNKVVFKRKTHVVSGKYYYNGMTLVNYCKENNINYNSIAARIIRMKKNSKLSIDKIINIAIKSYQDKFNKTYYYKGKLLKDYCSINDLNYEYIVLKINRQRKNNNKELAQIIDEIVSRHEILKYSRNLNYVYNGVPFADYCKENSLDYNNLRSKIRRIYFNKKDEGYSLEEIIDLVVKDTYKYKKRKKIKELQIRLNKGISKEEVLDACEVLNLDYDTVVFLSSKFSINQAINLVWCFSDMKNKDKKSISKERLQEVIGLVKKIKEGNHEDIDIRDLAKIYKCKLYDTREILLSRLDSLILGSVLSACTYYNVKLDKDLKEEFIAQARLYFLIAVDNTVDLKYNGRIVKYIYKRVNGYIKAYVREFNKQHIMKHLEQTVKEDLRLGDMIEDPNDCFEIKEKKSLDKNKYFSMLNKAEAKFMMLLYEENYSYDELAEIYKVSVERIVKKEKEIIEKIKKEEINIKR